jgi:hypothetical protein
VSRFTLTIDLGNDACQGGTDVCPLLRRAAYQIERAGYLDTDPTSILDLNGNAVGHYSRDFEPVEEADDLDDEDGPCYANLTLAELQDLPTLCIGHSQNLKIETPTVRVWLSRCGIADGMPYDNQVEVEQLIDGRWTETLTYEAI